MTKDEFLVEKCKEQALSEGGRILTFDELAKILETNRQISSKALLEKITPNSYLFKAFINAPPPK